MQFSQDSIELLYGEGSVVLADDIPYLQKKFYTLTYTTPDGLTPIDLTGATLSAEIIRRKINITTETPTGFVFTIEQAIGTPTPVTLNPVIVSASQGVINLPCDNCEWNIPADDPELGIAVQNPVCFSGYVKAAMPASGGNPAYDLFVFLLLLVRSNGVNLVA